MTREINVEVWSDIACPWCFIGKHRFAAGLEKFQQANPAVTVNTVSRSYELAPDTPLDFAGSEVDFLVKHKGMAPEQVRGMLAQMTEMAAAEGIRFDFDSVRHANTRRAHRVLHLAKERGMQAEVLERLFKAYFAEGVEMSDPDELARVCAEVGLDGESVKAALTDEALGEAVDRDIATARKIGVTGVPFFLFEGKYAVSGAQSPESFENVLQQVLELQSDNTEVG